MCGIAGIWRLGASFAGDGRCIAAMTRALAHRGPDDEAYALVDRATGHTTVTHDPAGHAAVDLLLGVRRLAITDLGPAGAHRSIL